MHLGFSVFFSRRGFLSGFLAVGFFVTFRRNCGWETGLVYIIIWGDIAQLLGEKYFFSVELKILVDEWRERSYYAKKD
ncbi:MAG: hypothetical protein LBG87_00950 [Spirochaetaceae bacterium]|jgi:hypothetical protein|nr:hypothetical protein [Spirochaetaceae bacterium]